LKDALGATLALTRIQKLIAARMVRSKREKACYCIKATVDLTEVMAVRRRLSKSSGARITSNTFFIRALALGARRYPVVLGRFEGRGIVLADGVNVGFAVNSAAGLMVPVIHDADQKSLAELAELDAELTDKARHNRLSLEDLEGETIALSNLGAYGVDSFVGITPPRASVILCAGNIVRAVVPVDGAATVRKVVELSLSADRRVVDEVNATRFLKFIKQALEKPGELI